MRASLRMVLAGFVALWMAGAGMAQEKPKDAAELNLDDLLNVKITAVSKKAESTMDAPGIVTVISRKEIEGYAAKNLGDILNRAPAALILSANDFTDNLLVFRGQAFTPYNNTVLFLVNGRPLRDPITGGNNSAVITGFPVDSIERIEVIRGPGSVLYGSCAFSGVINIVTRTLQEDGHQVKVRATAGNQGILTQGISGVVKSKDVNFQGAFWHYDDNGPRFEFTDYLNVHNAARFDHQNYSVQAALNYKGFSMNMLYLKQTGFGLAASDNNWDPGDPYDNNLHQTFMMDAGYQFDLSPKAMLATNLTVNRHIWTTDGQVDLTGNDVAGEGTLHYNPSDKVGILAGGTFSRNSWKGDLLIPGNQKQGSLYFQLDYRPIQGLQLIGGAQFNKIQNVDANLSPRFGLIYKFNESLALKVLNSTAFRKGYPLETSFNIIVFRGNMSLKPELINTTEVQLIHQTSNYELAATGFYSRLSDMIVRQRYLDASAPLGWYLQYVNGGKHTFYGLEFTGKGKIYQDVFLDGSFTWQTNRSEATDIKNAALHPNYMGKIGILYDNSVFSLSMYEMHVSKPHPVSLIASDVRVLNKPEDAFNLLSAKASVNLIKLFKSEAKYKVNLSFEAQNILDEDVRYPEYTSRGVNTLLPLRNGVECWGGLTFEF